MDSFSWSDGMRATFSSCLPCFAHARNDHGEATEDDTRTERARQSHYDELEGLLGDAEETDVDAETMSLHSNIGNPQQKRKKKKKKTSKKSIRLFGYDLFGRPPPIQLSESEDEHTSGDASQRRPSRIGRNSAVARSSSSNTSTSAFDSDAAPLDPAAIAALSAQDAATRAERDAAQIAAEEQERQEREERRRKRRERRELKRAAEAMAAQAQAGMGLGLGIDDEEFEGFQGSGRGLPTANSPGPFTASVTSSGSGPTSPFVHVGDYSAEDYGPFMGGGIQKNKPRVNGGDPADGEDADFGGGAYTRSNRSRGSDSSRSQSHSQSLTSASQSNANPTQYNHHYVSQTTVPSPGLLGSPSEPVYAAAPPIGPLADPPRKKKLSSKVKRSGASASSTSNRSSSPTGTSQSASQPSPRSPAERFSPREPYIVEHEPFHSPSHTPPAPDSVSGAVSQDASKFPSVGFGGMRRTSSAGLNSGVFLSRRGEE